MWSNFQGRGIDWKSPKLKDSIESLARPPNYPVIYLKYYGLYAVAAGTLRDQVSRFVDQLCGERCFTNSIGA